MEKDYSISVCRLLAIILIVSCHILQYFDNKLCWWLNVGVHVFLIISGYLYAKKGTNSTFSFCKKNFFKILSKYLIYIIPVMIIFAIFTENSAIDCIKALFFNGKVAGLGHLWYIPLILLCYLFTPLFNEMASYINGKKFKYIKYALLMIVIHYIVSVFFSYFKSECVNCYLIGIILGTLYNRNKKNILLYVLVIPFSVVLTYIVSQKIFEINKFTYYTQLYNYTHVILGLSIFLVANKILSLIKSYPLAIRKVLDFFDKYTYDIYLTHHIFVLGPFSLFAFIDNKFLAILLVLLFTALSSLYIEICFVCIKFLKTKVIGLFDLFKRVINKYKPIKKDRVVFMSYNGHINDNPLCVYNEMIKIKPDLDYIWLVNKEYEKNVLENTKYYLIDSKEGLDAYNSAHLIIDNVYGKKENYLESNSLKAKLKYKKECFLKNKKGQYVYTTWHATCLKKMSIDQIGNKIIDFSCPNTTMMMGNKYSLDILQHLSFDKIKMKLIGTPRNSILFNINDDLIKEKKQKLELPLDKKLVMFAPTFRTDDFIATKNIERSGINQLAEMDIDKLISILNKKFDGDFVLLFRFHYHVSEMVDWDKLKEKYGDKIINGNKSDETSDYLICTDVLISDVSGIMFDYSTTKKPVFIYFPDMDNYINKERGVYIPIEELPFSSSKNFNGLIDNINGFDNKKYLTKIDEFNKKIGVVDNKNSAKEVAKFILKDSSLI